MTIELETFYSGRLGSFWWDEVGKRGKGEVGAPSLQNSHYLLSRGLPGARPKGFSYSDPMMIFTSP